MASRAQIDESVIKIKSCSHGAGANWRLHVTKIFLERVKVVGSQTLDLIEAKTCQASK